MAKAKMYGSKSICVPNRVADKRRLNNAFWKGREFAGNDLQRGRDKQEKRMRKEKVTHV